MGELVSEDHVPTATPEGAAPATLEGLRALMSAELRTLNTEELLSRYQYARGIGATFGGKRDMYQILGYETVLTVEQYRERYERGGLAGSIVDVVPDATWRGDGELVEDENPETQTEFERQWAEFSKRVSLWSTFCRVDKLSRLSTYGVLLIGAKDGKLEQPLPKGDGTPGDIMFLDPYCGAGGWRLSGTRASRQRIRTTTQDTGADVTIAEWETDITNPRFGQPSLYRLRRPDFTAQALNQDIHWSRIIHIADGTLDDNVFGAPALARVWNLLDDLDKVVGGGAEAFWNRANRGLQLDIDKEVKSLSTDEKTELQQQVEAYVHQMSRVLRTRGVTVKELGSDVANFSSPGDFIVTVIAGTCRIPKRILTGSEMGELASTQDRENFRDIVIGRQTGYAAPSIVRRLADRLIEFGYLPKPKSYEVKWAHTQVLTELERADGATKWATINAQAVQATGELVFTNDEIREKWYGMAPLSKEQRKPPKPPAEQGAPQ